ncbi:MAG: NAD(+) diphosphatase [Alphaproteobacteria bacterium]|nr:NAD(+) diphosphatase [Alphaproteobacteria bacterium]
MSGLAFVSSLIDRDANNRGKLDYVTALRRDSTTCVVQIAGDQVRMEDKALYTANDAPDTEAVYLGLTPDCKAWFARSIAPEIGLTAIRSLMIEGPLPEDQVSLLAQARSVLHWHGSHGFCAKCGQPSQMMDAGYRRHCPTCQTDHFPRTDPVVIMAVRDGQRVLLGRQAAWPQGMFSALAGFMEPGETIEQAVAREVLEEAGIRVGPISYVTSQPWPFPASLMIGMIAEAASTKIVIDPAELETARWFERHDLEQMLKGTHPEGLFASRPQAVAHAVVTAALK